MVAFESENDYVVPCAGGASINLILIGCIVSASSICIVE